MTVWKFLGMWEYLEKRVTTFTESVLDTLQSFEFKMRDDREIQ